MRTDWGALALSWVQGRVRRKEIVPLTARNHRSALAGFCRVIGDRATIGKTDVERWLEETSGHKASTRRGDFSAVRAWCRWLVDEGHLRRDPTVGVASPREPRRVPRYLDQDQVAAVLDACPNQRARAVAWLMYGAGLRCSEVVGLEVGDWDRRAGTLRVTGKGGHQREVALPSPAAVELDLYLGQWPASSGPLIRSFREPGRPLRADTLSDIGSEIMRAAGVKVAAGDGVSFHALRHSCASDTMEASGGNVWLVAELLGHANISTTQIYLRRARTDEMREAVEGRRWPEAG